MERDWAGKSAPPPPILSQMWWDKQFHHADPAKELMTKARLMALGPAALQFQLGSLRPPHTPSLVPRQRKDRWESGQEHTGSVPRQLGCPCILTWALGLLTGGTVCTSLFFSSSLPCPYHFLQDQDLLGSHDPL